MAFPESIDPTDPVDTVIATVGPAELRAIKQFIVDLLGLPTAPTTITAAAMSISAAGIPTFPAGTLLTSDPTALLGAVTKQYVDGKMHGAVTLSGSGTFTTDLLVPIYKVILIGGSGGGAGGSSLTAGGGGGAGTIIISEVIGFGTPYPYSVGAAGAGGAVNASGGNGGVTIFGGTSANPGLGAILIAGGSGGAVAATGIYSISQLISFSVAGFNGQSGTGNSPGAGGVGWGFPNSNGGQGGSVNAVGKAGSAGTIICLPGA